MNKDDLWEGTAPHMIKLITRLKKCKSKPNNFSFTSEDVLQINDYGSHFYAKDE